MKKYFASQEYKNRNARHAAKSLKQRLLRKEKLRQKYRMLSGNLEPDKHFVRRSTGGFHQKRKNSTRRVAVAPNDFRLIENTEACLAFFRELRGVNYINYIKNSKNVVLSLKDVTAIDYGTISILTALSDDLKYKGVNLHGDFPSDPDCRDFIIESGFLNHMFDEKNHKFPPAEKSEMIFFEKGCGVLSEDSNKKISALVKNVVYHLTGAQEYSLTLKTIILEICGNSIEWSGTDNKQWLLGAKYEKEKVIFTVTDVGNGILDTLYRKFGLVLRDTFARKTKDEILKGAFIEKYGSTTQELNRNKGLPTIKNSFDNGTIKCLKVLTNNVILHFDNDANSRTFGKGAPRFKGTFYQMDIDKSCLNKIIS
jgi:hypothetical protein